jgi:hypothetical protein
LAAGDSRKQRSDAKAEGADAPFSQRATMRPSFDLEEFARQSERVTIPPPAGLPQYDPGLSSGTTEALSPLQATTAPAVVVTREDLEWFELPEGAQELFDQIDGETPVTALAARAAMSLEDAMAMLEEMARAGLVVWL